MNFLFLLMSNSYTLGEESSSCTYELSTSINSTDFSNTSTSNLQHASFSTPVYVLLEDTMHQLSIQNTVFTEDILLKTSHHIKDAKDSNDISEQSSSIKGKRNSEEIVLVGPVQETETT